MFSLVLRSQLTKIHRYCYWETDPFASSFNLLPLEKSNLSLILFGLVCLFPFETGRLSVRALQEERGRSGGVSRGEHEHPGLLAFPHPAELGETPESVSEGLSTPFVVCVLKLVWSCFVVIHRICRSTG